MDCTGAPCWPPVPCPSVPCPSVEWQPVAWCMPGAERGLAEASILLRLLMGPIGHPNRIREASPELRIALPGEAAPGICHQLGLSQPGSLHASLAPKSLWRSSSPEGGLRHLGSGRLFAELAGGGSRERGSRQPTSGTGPGSPRGRRRCLDPAVGAVTSCTRKLWAGQLSRAGTPRQEPE